VLFRLLAAGLGLAIPAGFIGYGISGVEGAVVFAAATGLAGAFGIRALGT
jgi:hypothetical protein